MSERDAVKKEMTDRLNAANKHLERIRALQEQCGQTFSLDAFKEVLTAQDAWRAEMGRYRQLTEYLKRLG